jgi:hypothetical protein
VPYLGTPATATGMSLTWHFSMPGLPKKTYKRQFEGMEVSGGKELLIDSNAHAA